jgi:hypothetical protein
MDPRVKLYSDIVFCTQLQRHHFLSWTPIDDHIQCFKLKLDKMMSSTPNIYLIPSIKKSRYRCYRCAQSEQDHECPEVLCESCGLFHDSNRAICEILIKSDEKLTSTENIYSRPCTTEELQQIRCFKCRKIGHICP